MGQAGAWPDYTSDNRKLNKYLIQKFEPGVNPNSSAYRVFFCPADKGYGGLGNQFDQLGTSYDYNVRANVSWPMGFGMGWRKLSQVKQPTKVILAGDTTMLSYYNFSSLPYSVSSYWHDRKAPWCNVVFVDGHASYILMRSIPPGNFDYEAPGGEWKFTAGAQMHTIGGGSFDWWNSFTAGFGYGNY